MIFRSNTVFKETQFHYHPARERVTQKEDQEVAQSVFAFPRLCHPARKRVTQKEGHKVTQSVCAFLCHLARKRVTHNEATK